MSTPNTSDVSLLLDDVGWHQKRARRSTAWGWLLLVVGLPLMVRLVIAGLAVRADPNAPDPWGPIDSLLIVGGIVCWSAALVLFRTTAVHRRATAALCYWQIFGADGRRLPVGMLRRRVASMPRLRSWLDRRHAFVVTPHSLPDAERRAQLFQAARSRTGTRQERADRFGEPIAIDFERVRMLRQGVAALICIALACVGAASVIGYVVDRTASIPYQVSRNVLMAAPLLIPFVGIGLSRSSTGFRPLAHRILPELRRRDGGADRNLALALLAKPRLYDVWAEMHPLVA